MKKVYYSESYYLEHGIFSNIGNAIKKGVSKLKGSMKKNHKYLRRELMPNGKYKYTYSENVSDYNKNALTNGGRYNNVTVQKKYDVETKKRKGVKYSYKELTSKGWRYYYENKEKTLASLNRAAAQKKQEYGSTEKAFYRDIGEEAVAKRNLNKTLNEYFSANDRYVGQTLNNHGYDKGWDMLTNNNKRSFEKTIEGRKLADKLSEMRKTTSELTKKADKSMEEYRKANDDLSDISLVQNRYEKAVNNEKKVKRMQQLSDEYTKLWDEFSREHARYENSFGRKAKIPNSTGGYTISYREFNKTRDAKDYWKRLNEIWLEWHKLNESLE